MIKPAAIGSGFGAISFLFLIPIAIVIYLDIRFVNHSIRKGGGMRVFALLVSFLISIGAAVWGLWSVFTEFSMALLFVGAGGGILLLFNLRALTLDKEDLKKSI